ncbi:MAG: response regulator transcription factor [Kofleriaceae bacterium]|nr:response regulator transcription factor [Kofleriaceae bacterium]
MPGGPCRVLMIEDDPRIAELTARFLETYDISVTIVGDGLAGEAEASRRAYDCIVLDLMLPGRDGMEVCRVLRRSLDVPIIMVTARTEEADRVLGLELGADDYLAKPFSARELLARIRSVVRRARGEVGPPRTTIDLGRLVLDRSRLGVRLDDRAVDVTPQEFAVLWALAEKAGRMLTREQLLDATGGAELAFDRSIDVHISRLRNKLGDDARRPRLLKTVRRVGYVLALDDPE